MQLSESAPKAKTNYLKPIFTGLLTATILIGGLFGWMAHAGIAGAVVASGSVIVRGKPKLVQHLDGGIVSKIYVKNGDRVNAGDILVELDETLLLANFEVYKNRLREAIARKARLEAERDGTKIISFDNKLIQLLNLGDVSKYRKGQIALFDTRRKARFGQIEQQNEKVEQFKNQIVGINALMKSKQEQLDLMQQELESIEKLVRHGTAPRNGALAQQRAVADMDGQLAEHSAELARIKNSIREIEINILQIERTFQEQVLSELREAASEVDDLKQQILATQKQIERVNIKAPVSGIVHELNVFTIGGVVPPGGTLMQIIAVEEGVEIEVNVEPQSIDQLYPGQQSTVRFPAFNQRTTPELVGKVDIISPSSIVDEKAGFSYYRVGITISPQELMRLNGLALVPGMPAEAFMKTEERTVLTYLFKPMSDQFKKAFREE